MNKKIFAFLILLMGISISGIIAVQLVWMNNALQVKNELFSRSVNEALSNTVNKLEDLHNFGVVNRLVFEDSMHWENDIDKNFDIDFFPELTDSAQYLNSTKKSQHPIRIIREFNPGKNRARVEIKMDTDRHNSAGTFTYKFDSKSGNDKEQIIIDGKRHNSNNVYFIQKDTVISNIDSLYTVGLVKIDSLLTSLDTFTIKPDFSQRVKTKATRLKKMANQVVTEITTWDINTIDSKLIQQVLSEELINKNVPIDFEFGILKDSAFQEIPFEITDTMQLLNTEYLVNLYPNDIIQKKIKLAVFFPNRNSFIYRSLNWLLIASFLFSVFILLTFGLSIFYILRQKKISEMKSDFINNMTHEFKTPIATISVATDSINNEKVVHNPERIKYFTGMIKKENTRMNRQVEDILTIARLDRKDFEFVWEAVDIHELIDDAIQGIVLQVEKRHGKIDSHFDAANPVITTDKMHCTNIIFNLLDNAIKYSDESPEIKVTTTNTTKGILVAVEDKGIGMVKSVQNKIFERFYRQTSGNIHNVKGFGLGLSYVNAILEANQGTISVQSEPKKGSKFNVFLPFVRE